MNKILLTFLLMVISGFLLSQVPTEQDCLGAIPVCQDVYVQENSWIGTGNYPNEINAGQSCPYSCMDGEKNDAWYIFSVQNAGLLRFKITPNNSVDDYDWAVYNLTEHECEEIYNNAIEMQASCNAAGGAGYQGVTGISTASGGTQHCNGGGNTNKWNADLPVEEGETYVLCVSNWTQTQYGYILDFSASTASIFDDSNPYISYIQESIGCAGETTLYIEFSENVMCESVQPTDFRLADSEGFEYTITDVVGEGCELGGEQESAYTLIFEPPIVNGGDYELEIIGQISDLCDNNAQALTYDFTLIEGLPPVDFTGLYPFWCVDDNPDTLYGNHYPEIGSGVFTGPGITDLGNNSALFDPGVAGPGGPYSITYEYTDAGDCSNSISRLVTVRGNPIQYTVAGGGEYCEGSEGPEIYLAENTSQAYVNYELHLDGFATGQVIVGTGIGGINFGPQNIPGIYTITASGNCGNSDMLGEAEIVMGELPAQYNVSGGGPYCEDINGTDIDLSDSQQGVVYELVLNGVLTGLMLDGTGNPVSFTNITTPGWYKIYADNGICTDTMSGSVQVIVDPVPASDAGEDQSIPYGTSTTLEGSGSGGIGELGYHWEPSASLLDPDISNPTTVNLEFTTTFNLTVTDVNGCDSDDDMVVTVTGGPLGVTVSADPEVLCQGESSQLHSIAGGGSEVYTYSWTSFPAGFTSNDPNPVVWPLETTEYILSLFDGYNDAKDSVTVTVNALPGTTAWADAVSIPYGSTTVLHAEATNTTGPHSYSWTPASLVTNATSPDPSTVSLVLPINVFSVTITNDPTGCYDTGEVEVVVTGGPLQIVSLTADPDEMCNTGDPVYLG
ncbi:MAG: hypothetical protein KAT48_06710, partial [Bacteroidales bacterium]|nr:hypothetical protein [Bacteroidales bacterium]